VKGIIAFAVGESRWSVMAKSKKKLEKEESIN
jgi:hypothetical protein